MLREAPPLARTGLLREQGLLPEGRSEINANEDLIQTRRLFQTLVRQDGWNWDLV